MPFTCRLRGSSVALLAPVLSLVSHWSLAGLSLVFREWRPKEPRSRAYCSRRCAASRIRGRAWSESLGEVGLSDRVIKLRQALRRAELRFCFVTWSTPMKTLVEEPTETPMERPTQTPTERSREVDVPETSVFCRTAGHFRCRVDGLVGIL